jgi:hypothetical protein
MRVEQSDNDTTAAPIVTESRNISGSGVYCISPHYLAPLSKVALTIVLPELPGRIARQRLLKCEGIVVRCQGAEGAKRSGSYRLACSFLGLESGGRQLLEEYVVWRNLQALRAGTRAASSSRAGARRARPGRAARPARTRSSGKGSGSGEAGRTGTRKRRTVH